MIFLGSLLTYFEVDNNYFYGCVSNETFIKLKSVLAYQKNLVWISNTHYAIIFNLIFFIISPWSYFDPTIISSILFINQLLNNVKTSSIFFLISACQVQEIPAAATATSWPRRTRSRTRWVSSAAGPQTRFPRRKYWVVTPQKVMRHSQFHVCSMFRHKVIIHCVTLSFFIVTLWTQCCVLKIQSDLGIIHKLRHAIFDNPYCPHFTIFYF